MPLYEYINKKTGEKFTEILPIDKRDFPCRNPFVKRVLTMPNIATISDNGGKEDKVREQIMQSAEKGYAQRDKEEAQGKIKVPEWSKEKRVKSKQKRQWL
tara:strand:+ start:340 stop:639 length:300 start_codon:yes stop_codon:yes gene_type:complete